MLFLVKVLSTIVYVHCYFKLLITQDYNYIQQQLWFRQVHCILEINLTLTSTGSRKFISLNLK